VFACFQLAPITHWLWPVPLAFFVVYPYLKRFTWFCHFWLGICLGLGVTGGWAAVGAPLSNPALFRRDNHLCLYCGFQFRHTELSRDHIHPISRGGSDSWGNVVTACKRCNNHKAGRTPEQAGMQLLAIPFTPTHAEYVYLQGRRVLSDQMEFLKAHFPRKSPLHQRQS
jgi:hypothetical protein